jgi:hypothetical protein
MALKYEPGSTSARPTHSPWCCDGTHWVIRGPRLQRAWVARAGCRTVPRRPSTPPRLRGGGGGMGAKDGVMMQPLRMYQTDDRAIAQAEGIRPAGSSIAIGRDLRRRRRRRRRDRHPPGASLPRTSPSSRSAPRTVSILAPCRFSACTATGICIPATLFFLCPRRMA